MVIKTIRVMLLPNNKQKTKLFQYANTARFAYNWALGREQENYKNGGKFISDGEKLTAYIDENSMITTSAIQSSKNVSEDIQSSARGIISNIQSPTQQEIELIGENGINSWYINIKDFNTYQRTTDKNGS